MIYNDLYGKDNPSASFKRLMKEDLDITFSFKSQMTGRKKKEKVIVSPSF